VRDIVARLSPQTERKATPSKATTVLGVPAESDADALLLEMLALTLRERHGILVTLDKGPREKTVTDALAHRPEVVCIAALPPGGSANARFLCRRLRAALPEARLLVLRPEPVAQRSQESAARLREAGASGVSYGIREASELLLGSYQGEGS
jgi:hypothetical protein